MIAGEWRQLREQCRVRRFWGEAPDEIGRLVHRSGGTGGASWVFDYDPDRPDDDEPGFKLDRHQLSPGEYISITEHDRLQRTFRVVSVIDLERVPAPG